MGILEERKKAGLTRKEMVERFQIPYRTIQSWEVGARQCPPWAERLIIKELQSIKKEAGK